MAGSKTKAVALTVAAGVMTFGVNQAVAGDPVAGVLAVAIGLVVFGGYQFAEDNDHAAAYNDIVEAIGEDTLEELSKMGAEQLRRLQDEALQGQIDDATDTGR